jgi:hypothetical protein
MLLIIKKMIVMLMFLGCCINVRMLMIAGVTLFDCKCLLIGLDLFITIIEI